MVSEAYQSEGGGTAPHGICDPWARWLSGPVGVGEFVVVFVLVLVVVGWVAAAFFFTT